MRNFLPPFVCSSAADAQRQQRPFRMVAGGEGPVQVSAASAAVEGGEPSLPTFTMVGYTGGEMWINWYGRVVVDLSTARMANPIRALLEHDPSQIVGHGEAEVSGKRILASGVISGGGEAARTVVDSAKNGFPWQASIGADPTTLILEEVRAGASVKVNDKTFKGPLTVVRGAVIREISFVALGADGKTSGNVAAQFVGGSGMEFNTWLRAHGYDPDQLSDGELALLKRGFEAEAAAGDNGRVDGGDDAGADAGDDPDGGAQPQPVQAGQHHAPDAADAAAAAVRAERVRQAGIEATCTRALAAGWCKGEKTVKKVQALAAAARSEETSVEEFQQQVLEASYSAVTPVTAGVVVVDGSTDARALEAAMCMQARVSDEVLTRDFQAQTLDSANRMRRIPLKALIAEAAALDGVVLSRREEGTDRWIRAAATSLSLTGILSNTANKVMLEAYRKPESVIRKIFGISQVSDFKQHTRYRLTSDMVFKKVTVGGELKHGEVGEQSFTQQADTYGRYFELDRQMIVNDDLGAFLRVPRLMGRGAALSIEEIGFTLILANTGSFFAGAKGNYGSGAGTALSTTSLSTAVQYLEQQTDPQGKPVVIMAKFLVVPSELRTTAEEIYKGQNLIVTALGATDAAAIQPGRNIHAGRYVPLSTPYLSNSSFHASASATGWYLFGDPEDVPAFDLAFLNGVDVPTIEQVGVPPQHLGIGFRGYQDVGVAQQDHRGAVFMAGA